MGDLTREAILGANDVVIEPLEVEEWGGTVYIRGLSSQERDSYDRTLVRVGPRGQTSVGNLDNVRATLAVRCIVDQEGNRLFSDKDAAELGKKSSSAVQRVWELARKLSGMDDETVEAEAEVFVEAQDDVSSSA